MTPDERYARCEVLVVGWEGGAVYTNNPKDAGGPTRFGITLAALTAWRGKRCLAADVQALTAAEAMAIYRAQYWNRVCGDALPAGVDLIVFDAAVNMGRNRAGRVLQGALDIEADGVISPLTLGAVAACSDRMALIERIRVERARLYASFDRFPVFGRGWLRRLEACATTAKAWAAKAV